MSVTNFPLVSNIGGTDSSVLSYDDYTDFPVTGAEGVVYVDKDNADIYLWDGAVYELQGGGSSTGGYAPGVMNPDTFYLWRTDFEGQDREGFGVVSNDGGGAGQTVTNDSQTGVNSTENAYGVFQMTLSNAAAPRLALYAAGFTRIGSQKINIGARAYFDTTSAANPTYIAYMGIFDNLGPGDMTDGLYFRYTHSENGGRWQGVSDVGGVRTTADTGVAFSAGAFNVFEIEINQAGNEAKFYINGSLVATISASLTTAVLRAFEYKIEKSAGASGASMLLDWIYIQTQRASVR